MIEGSAQSHKGCNVSTHSKGFLSHINTKYYSVQYSINYTNMYMCMYTGMTSLVLGLVGELLNFHTGGTESLAGLHTGFFRREGKFSKTIFYVHAQYITHEGLGTRLLIKHTFFLLSTCTCMLIIVLVILRFWGGGGNSS